MIFQVQSSLASSSIPCTQRISTPTPIYRCRAETEKPKKRDPRHSGSVSKRRCAAHIYNRFIDMEAQKLENKTVVFLCDHCQCASQSSLPIHAAVCLWELIILAIHPNSYRLSKWCQPRSVAGFFNSCHQDLGSMKVFCNGTVNFMVWGKWSDLHQTQ